MQNQIPLFDTEEHQPQAQQRPRSASGPLRGTIQRSADELQASHTDWIQRTSDLKFKRIEKGSTT